MSLSPQSPDATPSTPSSPSTQRSSTMDVGMSGSSNSTGSAQSTQESGRDDAERFRKRLELEQTMQGLQRRLELANIKAKNGWTGMTINEIENKLPARRRREDMRVLTGVNEGINYEPPSPSRPWQLVDVLWQPLPPPSRGPLSPSSPLKRTRDDPSSPSTRPIGAGHSRRASGSSHPLSPIDQMKRREKKRSQSHSITRLRPTTQDFNAAQALTEMLSGSGSPSSVPSSSFSSSRDVLPLPPAFQHGGGRRSSSAAPINRKKVDEEDKNAAELMMFLAQSPPAKTRSGSMSGFGGTARVLFADEKEGPGRRIEERSNLGLAPPITAGDENGFGGLL